MQILDKITLLNETILECLKETDEDKILKHFVDAGLKVLEADFGFVWLNSLVSNKLELAYKSPNLPYEPKFPEKGGRNYRAMQTLAPDFTIHTKKTKDTFYVSKYLESFVILPLFFKKDVYGTMVLCFKKVEFFSEEKRILSIFIGNSLAQVITIRRSMEKEKKEHALSEKHDAYFKALIENSHEIIMLLDRKLKIFYVSPSISKIYKTKPEYILGKNVIDFIQPDDEKRVRKYLDMVIKGFTVNGVIESSHKRLDGSIISFESTAFNMLDDPNIGGVVLNIRDVTIRKNADKSKENERLLEEERMKTEFIANATHEIRTPLAIIKGNVDLALMKRNTKFRNDAFKAINNEVDHLSNMVLDLTLLTTKGIEAKDKMMFEEVNLVDVAKKAENRCMSIAKNKNISISVKRSRGIFVKGDESYLERLFINLIKNAITYGKRGGFIHIEFEKKEDNVEVRVSDNGIGISEKDLPYVFNRFYKAKKVQESSEERRTGLGLAIVKWTVKVHGGRVWVKSKKDEGSTFFVSFPLLKLH